MNPEFQAVRIIEKDGWAILVLHTDTGRVTPTMRVQMGTHTHVKRIVTCSDPHKIFVLTPMGSHADKGPHQQRFVKELEALAAA